MQFLIIYFSGTGNTELISREIKNRLEATGNSVETVSIDDLNTMSKLDFNDKIIGFGYPVYKFTYPDIFNNVLPIIKKKAHNNKYFQFSTYTRFAADALYDFSQQLDSNNFNLFAQAEFKCPSCGISARLPVDDYEYQSVMFFEDDINKKLDCFTTEILNNIDGNIIIKQQTSPLSNLKKKIVENIEITKYPKLKINSDRCITCGLCARNCPDSNLINKKHNIEVVDDKGCLHCLRCMNHCPQNAITFGKLTEGDNQYTLKVRDMLYKKSADGHKEKYWEIFDKVIAMWRRKTIKYWITHFYKAIICH